MYLINVPTISEFDLFYPMLTFPEDMLDIFGMTLEASCDHPPEGKARRVKMPVEISM
jgi:hypothetical protein